MATLTRKKTRGRPITEATALGSCEYLGRARAEPFLLRLHANHPAHDLRLTLTVQEVHAVLGSIPAGYLLEAFDGDADRAGRWIRETAVAVGLLPANGPRGDGE